MYAEERQHAIADRARTEGRVDVAQLASDFGVTTETVRRDLTVLVRHGVLRRVHGGAIPVDRLGFEPALADRDAAMSEEKERIARAALQDVPDEGAILLDAGTTTARLGEILPPDARLTVVTNSLPIAMTLASRPNLQVLSLGGRVRGRTAAMVDAWALRVLEEMVVDVAFMGANGVSAERGLTTPDTAEAAVKRAMIASARHVAVLADHTKVGRDHFARFGDLEDVDVLFTDDGLDLADAVHLESKGLKVIRA